jgi:hypothetical protein
MAVLAFPAKLKVRLAIGSDRQRPGSLKTIKLNQRGKNGPEWPAVLTRCLPGPNGSMV